MKNPARLLTPKQVKAEFERHGVTIADWAREHGFPPPLVYRVLNGASPKRGTSHKIAVQLGIKDGEISGLSGLPFSQADSSNHDSPVGER